MANASGVERVSELAPRYVMSYKFRPERLAKSASAPPDHDVLGDGELPRFAFAPSMHLARLAGNGEQHVMR